MRVYGFEMLLSFSLLRWSELWLCPALACVGLMVLGKRKEFLSFIEFHGYNTSTSTSGHGFLDFYLYVYRYFEVL